MKPNLQSKQKLRQKQQKQSVPTKVVRGRSNNMLPEQPNTKLISNQTEGFIHPENFQASFSLEIVT